jgi:hypothetical protein
MRELTLNIFRFPELRSKAVVVIFERVMILIITLFLDWPRICLRLNLFHLRLILGVEHWVVPVKLDLIKGLLLKPLLMLMGCAI